MGKTATALLILAFLAIAGTVVLVWHRTRHVKTNGLPPAPRPDGHTEGKKDAAVADQPPAVYNPNPAVSRANLASSTAPMGRNTL